MKSILTSLTGKPYLNERTGMYEYRTNDGKDAWIRKAQVVDPGAWTGVRPPGACGTGGPPTGAAWRCTRAWRRAGGRG